MSSNFTPGPWQVRKWTCHTATTIVVPDKTVTTGVRVIAECESEEDAKLMGAALDLCEAARAAMQCIGELPPTQPRVEVAQMLQFAIEKATGKQS